MQKTGRFPWRRLLYMICFALFCLIDQRTKTYSGPDGWLDTFRDLTGVVMAVIIFSHYRFRDFWEHRLVYLLWNIFAGFGGVWFWRYGQPYVTQSGYVYAGFAKDRLAIALGVLLFGNIVIHTFMDVVIYKRLPRLNKVFFVPWILMMWLMNMSRSTYIWPLTHLVMFGCFYLTDFSGEEREDLFQGMLDGIILAFFLMQGWCFVFRPYDSVRYVGVHVNPNMNAFFYLEVLAAVLSRIVCLTKRYNDKTAPKWVLPLKIFYWLGAGVVYSFLFLTIGRTAWIVSFILGLLFLVALNRVQHKKRFFRHGVALALCACLMFPLVFGAVRYLPPKFHHPVWFYGEWHRNKVHSWDPWDSEKYIELDEFLDVAGGRATEALKNVLRRSPFKLTAKAAEAQEQYEQMLEQGYALLPEQRLDSVVFRGAIYRYYWKHLNFWGYPYQEQGFQLLPTYWVWHAHNIYLQYGTDFGVPMMVIFIMMVIGTIIYLAKKFWQLESEIAFSFLIFFLVTMLFGLLECSWGVSSVGTLMLFITWREVCVDEEKQ